MISMRLNSSPVDCGPASTLGEKIPGLELELDTFSRSCQPERGYSPIPTPPDSHSGSPIDNRRAEGNIFLSVSTTFFPQSSAIGSTDILLITSDLVCFYVSSKRLQAESQNGFNSHLPPLRINEDSDCPIINVPELSPVINILLHTICGMSCMHYCHSLADISAAVTACRVYGLSFEKHLALDTPLFQTVISHAPTSPLEVYTLAASHGLHELAVGTSSHLLSFQLQTLTDELAMRIGPVYLKKLFFMHLGRTEALKQILVNPPLPHAQTEYCDFNLQKPITCAWSLAIAYLTLAARPDMSASMIEKTLQPLAEHLTCSQCKKMLLERIQDVVFQWSLVKRTI